MRRSALALVALLVLSSIALPALASPQPTPVCGPCGGGFEEAAAYHQFDVAVVHSTATVRVHRDGSATWRVENRLANESTARTLRERPDLLQQITERAITTSTLEGPTENLSARVENRTVVLTFEDPHATTRMPGGVHVVDYLHSRGYDSWYVLTADRLSVVGPEGTAVTNDPHGAEVRGRNATWHGNGSAPVWDAPTVTEDAYVTFAEPGPTAPAATTLATTLATLPIVVAVLGSYHLPALLLFGVVLLGVAVAVRRLCPRFTPALPAQALVGVGVIGLLWSLAGMGLAGRVAMGFAGVALATGGLSLARDDVSPTTLGVAGLVGLVLGAVAVAVTLPGNYPSSRVWTLAGRTALLLPLVVAPALGAALRADRLRATAIPGLLALAAFLLGELVFLWPTERPFGAVILLLGGYALAAAALSAPFLLLGATRES